MNQRLFGEASGLGGHICQLHTCRVQCAAFGFVVRGGLVSAARCEPSTRRAAACAASSTACCRGRSLSRARSSSSPSRSSCCNPSSADDATPARSRRLFVCTWSWYLEHLESGVQKLAVRNPHLLRLLLLIRGGSRRGIVVEGDEESFCFIIDAAP